MGVRVKMFYEVAEVDTFLESRDDIDYLDLKIGKDNEYILVYEEIKDEETTFVKGFEHTSD